MSMVLSEETARLILERIQSRSQLVCGLAARQRFTMSKPVAKDARQFRTMSIDQLNAILADAQAIETAVMQLADEVADLLGKDKDQGSHLGSVGGE